MPGLGIECFQGLIPEQTECEQPCTCKVSLTPFLSTDYPPPPSSLYEMCVCVRAHAGVNRHMCMYVCVWSFKSTTVWKKKKREIAVFELKTYVSVCACVRACACRRTLYLWICVLCVYMWGWSEVDSEDYLPQSLSTLLSEAGWLTELGSSPVCLA